MQYFEIYIQLFPFELWSLCVLNVKAYQFESKIYCDKRVLILRIIIMIVIMNSLLVKPYYLLQHCII